LKFRDELCERIGVNVIDEKPSKTIVEAFNLVETWLSFLVTPQTFTPLRHVVREERISYFLIRETPQRAMNAELYLA